DSDLGDAASQTLTTAEVERHTGPSPRSDLELDGGVRFGNGFRVHSVFGEETIYFLAPLPAAVVLSTRGGKRQVVRKLHSSKNLFLLGTQVLGRQADRLFHRGEREQLKK